MPLDPRLQTFLEQRGLLTAPGSIPRAPKVLLTELRANDEKAKALAAQAAELLPVACVEDLMVPVPAGAVPIRLYTPEGTGPFPILLYFHGGGWVAGNLDSEDSGCRYFCREAGCLVLSVDYRLPPEHPFPAGLEDCYAASCWLASHAAQFQGDSTRIAVCGASGGGNFAAAIALMCRDRDQLALRLQVLLVPVVDFSLATSSWQNYDGYMMTSGEFLIARDMYLPNEQDRMHSYAAPLHASNLLGLPPTLIITAECDPVRDGGEHYGQRLQEAGIPTTITRYDGMPHGFMGMGALVPQANEALAEAVHALRSAFTC